MKKTVWIIGLVFLVQVSVAQENDKMTEVIRDYIEQISSASEQEIDFTSLFDDLSQYYSNPLNINTAKFEDLEKFQFLTEFQIRSLLDYVAAQGVILSKYEIAYIYGFDRQTVELLEPFITWEGETKSALQNPFGKRKYQRHEVMVRLQTLAETPVGYEIQPGDTATYYPGNKLKYYLKYKWENKNYSAGFVAEKDPGEEFFKGNRKKGFDYYSGYVMMNQWGKVDRLIVGDYGACFGQGLTVWSRYAGSKSGEVIDIRKRNQGIQKYSSSDENNFFRGVATTIGLKKIKITTFISSKNSDASIITDSLGNRTVNSILISGIHATTSQEQNRKNLNEKAAGASIEWSTSWIKLGINCFANRYDVPMGSSDNPYRKFDFSRKNNSNISIDYTVRSKSLVFFGEAARSQNNRYALLTGTSLFISDRVSASFLIRHFQKNHQALYSKPFAENSTAQNETGWYAGIRFAPLKYLTFSAYFDHYRFPWLKYSINSPSEGYEALVQASYDPVPETRFTLRYSYKSNPVNIRETPDEGFETETTAHSEIKRWRVEISHKVNPQLFLKTRLDWNAYTLNSNTETGYYLFQDIQYSLLSLPLEFSFRYGIFDTDSYATRMYAYETDVLYAFSVPAVYSKGMRSYLMASYSPTERIDFWARIGQTWYADKTEVGTGPDMVNGSAKTDIKVQMRIKF